MEPELVGPCDWYEVETTEGLEVVPAELVGHLGLERGDVMDADCPGWKAAVRSLRPFLAGSRVYEARLVVAWGVRLSMPGYMDCTEWSLHESEGAALQAAMEALDEEMEAADE